MADSPAPDWRNSGTPPADGGRAWHSKDAGAGAAPRGGRNVKRFVALFLLFLLAVGIGIVLMLPRAIRPACLVLIGSGYETNLLLPSNVHGWNGGLQLLRDDSVSQAEGISDRFRFFFNQPAQMRRIEPAFELAETGWDETWARVSKEIDKGGAEENVAIFVSALGLADESEVYLMRNVTGIHSPESFAQARVPFRSVLDSIKSVGAKKKILLVLDVCPVQSHWAIGMVHNDFSDRLQAVYEKDIESMSNLAVLCSTAPDQRSWASDEWQASAFSHFVIQGLKGAGHGQHDRVTAASLFAYVKDSVNTWARINRARVQTPILLGSPKVADRLELVRVVEPYEKPTPVARDWSDADLAVLTENWADWKAIKKNHAPHVRSPQNWRHYQDALLRHEQLLRAGDPTGQAKKLHAEIKSLHAELVKSSAMDKAFGCIGNNFPIHQVLGFLPGVKVPVQDQVAYLETLQSGDAVKREEAIKPFSGKSIHDRRYWQVRLSRRLLADLLEKRDFSRARTRELLMQIARDFDVPQHAVEVHLVKLLENVDPAFDKLDPKAELLKKALRVRKLAEESALGLPGDEESSVLYAEAVYKRLRAEVESADRLRREGEDLLFGDPKECMDRAGAKLDEARERYEQIGKKAQELRRAMVLRDELAADLPYLAAMLASFPGTDGQPRARLDELRRKVEKLCNSQADLSERLGRPEIVLPDIARLAKELKELRDGYQTISAPLATQAGGLQKNWHAIDGALGIPPMDSEGDVKLRLALLKKQRDISTGIHVGANPDGQTEELEPLAERVETQRKLLRACLKPYAGTPQTDAEARESYLKLPGQITDNAETLDDEPKLSRAVTGCRAIPGGLAAQIKDRRSDKKIDPVERLRRLQTYQMLHWLAQRTLDDHWFEPSPQKDAIDETTLYRPAANAYLDAAAALYEPKTPILKSNEELRQAVFAAGLTLANTPTPYWTTEQLFPMKWTVKAEKGVPEGMPTAWLEVRKGLARPVPQLLKPRATINPWSTKGNAQPAFELRKEDFEESGFAIVAFHTVYRGQHLVEVVLVRSPPPDVIVRHTPGPAKVGFAVRMDAAFDYGAISIVLDNSASMKYLHPKRNPKDPDRDAEKGQDSRFDYALKALRQVLERIPDGTELSIVTLGEKEATGPVLFRPTERWEQGALESWMGKLKHVPREYDSPIARGIIRAMQEGFPRNFAGPKVVVVLTDGMDNYSFDERKADLAGNTASVKKALKKANLDHPDIDVVVVCFMESTDREMATAKDQFEHINEFTVKSRFVPQADARELGRTIEDLLRPYVQLKKLDGTPAPGFEKGRAVNYFRTDGSLNKKPFVDAGNYQAGVLRDSAKPVMVRMPTGHNIFAVLNRKERTIFLERGIVGRQPEVAGKYPSKQDDDWLVTLLENHKSISARNLRSQVIAFEKTEAEAEIRQAHPGFVWLELDAVQGKRPETTLEWGNDTTLPMPAYRLEMPGWQSGQQPKLTAWYWPNERERFLTAGEKLMVQRKISIPYVPDGPNDPIESVQWERRKVGKEIAERDCLAVRLRYAPQKAIVPMAKDYPDTGYEHHHFLNAGRTTAYFHDLPIGIKQVNLTLVQIDAFRSATTTRRVEFTPGDQILEVPPIFRFETRD